MAFVERFVTDAAAGGGDGQVGTPWTLAEALTNAVAGDRVNILSDSGYSLAADTMSNAGTIASSIVYRGYNTTIGDLEGQGRNADGTLDTTNFPAITLTGTLTPNTYCVLEALNITGALSAGLVSSTSVDHMAIIQCAITNTQNNASARCVQLDNALHIYNSDMECSGAAHATVVECDNTSVFAGTRFKSVANICLQMNSGIALGCLFHGSGSHAGISWISTTVDHSGAYGCTFYGLGTGVTRANSATTTIIFLVNNHATDCAKWIDNLFSATANTAFVEINNRTRDNTTPRTGVGDWPNIGEITTDTGGIETDYTAAGSDDFTLISAAPGKAAGMVPFSDCGAYQREEPAGGGGSLLVHPGMGGGMRG